jgi:hypothetical protein
MEFNTFLTTVTLPDTALPVDPASLFALLAQVPDPRKRRGRRYALAVILTLMILAKLAGEPTPSEIAHWTRLRTDWLCDVLHLPRRRLPCANTYTLIAAKLDVTDLNRRLADFFVPPLPPLPAAPLPEVPLPARAQRHLALDRKTLHGTRRTGQVVQPVVHLLGMYDVTHQGMLAQVEVATKEHEIPGATTLIANRDLRGCVVTADVLHTQRQWWRSVRTQGGDSVLIVKQNQRGLLQDLALLFESPWPAWLEQRSVTTLNNQWC